MMRVVHAFGDTPLAQAAQIHEAAGRVRTCCEEHTRADVELIVAAARQQVRPPVERERQVEHVPPEVMAMVLR